MSYFTEQDIFEVHSCLSMYPHLVLFIADLCSMAWTATVGLSIHQMMNTLVVPHLGLLQIMLLRTVM